MDGEDKKDETELTQEEIAQELETEATAEVVELGRVDLYPSYTPLPKALAGAAYKTREYIESQPAENVIVVSFAFVDGELLETLIERGVVNEHVPIIEHEPVDSPNTFGV